MTQYVVVYFPHGATQVTEANGPYRSYAKAQQECDRLQAIDDDEEYLDLPALSPTIVTLGHPVGATHPAISTDHMNGEV